MLTNFLLFLTVDPPKITRHPESKLVATGASTTVTVEATGGNLQFQWQKDGQDIDMNVSRLQCSHSDNTSTLHIYVVEKSDKGLYKCFVKNPVEKSGKVSHVAELSVCEFPNYVCNGLPVIVNVIRFCITCYKNSMY